MRSPAIHLALAFFVGIMVLSGYWFLYDAIAKKSTDVANLQAQIAATTENVNRVASARVALAEIAGDETNVQNYFVSEAGVVAFIDNLEALGSAQKAVVNVLSVSANNPSSRPTLSLALSVKGTFDAVMRTIGSIEYMPYAVSIAALSAGQDTKNSWQANFNIIVGSVPVGTSTASMKS